MAFREKIELLIDVMTTGARSSLQNLKRDVDDADGAFGKMKAGASSAFGGMGNLIAGGVSAAGAAIGGFALKAIGDFQDVALEAGKMGDKLGMPVEDASRLMEVSGDLGIELSTLETAIGRMNKTAATSPEKFDSIGASIARNKDGTIDVTETFKNAAEAISRIPDAAERAKAAQDLFGKGWMGISEMIKDGAGGITAAMAAVENAKVIDDREVEKARKFRDMMDTLKGKFESFALTVGEVLVDAAAGFELVIEKAKDLAGWLTFRDARRLLYDNVVAPIKAINDEMEATYNGGLSQLIQGIKDITAKSDVQPVIDQFADLREELEQTRHAAEGAATGFSEVGDFVEDVGLRASSVKKVAEELNDAMRSADWGASKVEAASTAMSAFSEQQFALKDILREQETAWADYSAAVKANGLQLDVTTEAGGEQHEALKKIAQTIDTQLVSAYQDAKGDGDKFQESATKIANTLRDRLQKELGLSTEDAESLIRQLGLTPKDIQTRYQLTGDEEARIKIGLLQGAIENLPRNTRLHVENQIINGDYAGAIRTIQDYNNRHHPTARVDAIPGDIDGGRNAVQSYNNNNPTTVRVNAIPGNRYANVAVADGGIIESFAPGGVRGLPDQAVIQQPGTMVQWAEPETGGEAFIPLARSKERRSKSIWAQVGRRQGWLNFADGGITDGGSSAAAGGGGITINLSVNVAAGANPVTAGQQIADTLIPYLRTGGAGRVRRELGISAA